MPFSVRSTALWLATAALVAAAAALGAQPPREPITIHVVPPDLGEIGWLEALGTAQRTAVDATTLVHDFRFTDRLADSGITFRHRIVDDAGKTYKPAHYDHGTGIAIADVDGDGLSDIYFVNQVGGNQLWRNRGGGRFEDITATSRCRGAAEGQRLRPRLPTSTTTATRTCSSRRCAAGNHLFENIGGGRFRDITDAAGVGYRGHSSAAVFFDYDRDGLLDLFVVNVGRYTTDVIGGEAPGYHVAFEDAFSGHLKPERAERSILYRNQGSRRFVDATEKTGLVDLSWSGDATPIDGNDDGWPDLYVPEHARRRRVLRERGRAAFREAQPRRVSAHVLGLDGREGLRHEQ